VLNMKFYETMSSVIKGLGGTVSFGNRRSRAYRNMPNGELCAACYEGRKLREDKPEGCLRCWTGVAMEVSLAVHFQTQAQPSWGKLVRNRGHLVQW
jgi:hypothetical protein